MFEGKRILVTGPTSQVGRPVVAALARDNDVFAVARFSRDEDREAIEALGTKTLAIDLARGEFEGLPDDFDYVLNFAVVKSGDFGYDLATNAEGAGLLMAHCRRAKAFLHCSTGGVYQYAGHKPLGEEDPLGDNHRVLMPTYSLSKIAAESVVRFAARQWQIPTTIARLSVPYGSAGGWPFYHLLMMKAGTSIPIHPEQPNLYNLIHEDDYIRMLPGLLEIASVPASTINWGGNESVSIEDWCAYLGELTGLEARFELTERSFGSVLLDTTRMQERVGPCEIDWHDGFRRMVETLAPDLMKPKSQ